MINILICDDEAESVKHNQRRVEEFFLKTNANYHILPCTNMSKLHETIEENKIDIAILDIDLTPQINGIELAKKLSTLYQNCIVIFITNHSEFAMDAFKVSAFGYLKKPVKESEFTKLFEKVVYQLNGIKTTQKQCSFEIISNRCAYQLKENEVFYIEKIGQKLEIKTRTETYIVYESLKLIQNRLSKNFIKISSGLLVNRNNIEQVSSQSIILKNKREIPISRKLYRQIKAESSLNINT